MKYKALMLDLDGTTIPNSMDGMPSKRVKQALHRASRFIHVGIATSRPSYLTFHITDHLSLKGPSILSGGAKIFDLPGKQLLWEKPILKHDAETVIELFKKVNIPYMINDNDQRFLSGESYIPNKPLHIASLPISPDVVKDLEQQLAHIPTIAVEKINAWESGKENLMVSHTEATKQYGILKVAELLNIQTNEIIGVGDSYNDFRLLMACGLKVAMGNAVPELKAIADFIAPSVEEDGVATVVEKFILP